MISVCVVADTHRKHRELAIPACDILIHCGDFCSFQNDDQRVLDDVDSWFAEVPAKHIVCIGGNHDFLLQSRQFRFSHATFLEDRRIEIEGLTLYGSPWCPDLVNFAYYADDDQLKERWKKIPQGVDVLITHTPPYGLLDLPTSGSIHLGCPHLLAELDRVRPKLHVFGHVHASHGTQQGPFTKSINAAIVGGSDFEVRHTPTTISLRPSS